MRKNAIEALELAQKDDKLSLMQLLGTLWRGKWLIFLCTILAILAGGYYTFAVAVPKFTSSTMVVLESRDSQVVDFESVVSGLSADAASINTEVEVLRGRILISKLVDQLGLIEDPEFNIRLSPGSRWSATAILEALGFAREADPAPSERALRDAVIDRLLENISVTNIRNSYVFQISAKTEHAEKSALISDTLAKLYINDQLTTKFQATEKATAWLAERVSELKAELATAETAVKDYNTSTDLIGPKALAALNRQLKELRIRYETSQSTLDGLTRRITAMETATDDIQTMALTAEDNILAQMANRIGDGAEEERQSFKTGFEQLLTRLRAERDRAQIQVVALAKSVTEKQAMVEAQSADLVRLQQLEREAAASGLIYEYFLSRLKETSVQEGIQQADSRVLSYAVVPEKPSAPRKIIILSLCAFTGLIVGMVLILLLEMRQTGFRTAEDLERAIGVPVLGQIPRGPNARRRKILNYIVLKPTSALVEAVRNLRTSILLSNVDAPPQVIMLASSVPGEGKTTQSLALAHNFSGLGNKVLVVEGDIRRRTFREYFDITGQNGLVTAVTGEAPLSDLVWRSEQLGVDILIGEEAKVNAADFFSSDRFAAFIKAARKTYDVILIDTPPVLVVPDARVIAQVADAVVYVVHWDRTPQAQVEQGLRTFATANINVTGMVLSQINPKGMKRYGVAYAASGSKYYGN